MGGLRCAVIYFKCHPNRLRGYGAMGGGSKMAPLLWPVAYTTACRPTTVQTVMCKANIGFRHVHSSQIHSDDRQSHFVTTRTSATTTTASLDWGMFVVYEHGRRHGFLGGGYKTGFASGASGKFFFVPPTFPNVGVQASKYQ